MAELKLSQGTTVTTFDGTNYIIAIGTGTNLKISWTDLLALIIAGIIKDSESSGNSATWSIDQIKTAITALINDSASSGTAKTWSIDKIKSSISDLINDSSSSSTTETWSINQIKTAIAGLVDSAPGTLDTLNELAAALGDDPNYAATISALIGTKEPAISAGTTSQYFRGDKSWRDFGTDVLGSLLTGLSTASSTVITAGTNLITALGSLQKQILDLVASVAQKSTGKIFNTAADLRAFDNSYIPGTVQLKGITAAGDGLAGFYNWNPADTGMDDSYYRIKLTSVATGRYNRIEQGVPLNYVYTKLGNWFRKLATLPINTLSIGSIGDSTMHLAGNAITFRAEFGKYCQPGEALAGFDFTNKLIDLGSNGNTLKNFVENPTATSGLNDVINANLDLGLISYLTNDARTNLHASKEAMREYLITGVNKLRAGSPGTDWVLIIPYPFLTTNLSGSGFVEQGPYPDRATAAQTQSDWIFWCYKTLENYWPNVFVLDARKLVTGNKSNAIDSFHTDEIHPHYAERARIVTDVIGDKEIYRQPMADNARIQSPTTPWTIYPRVCEDNNFFDLVLSSKLRNQDTTNWSYIDVDLVRESFVFQRGDIVVIADTLAFESPAGSQTIPNNLTTRLLWANGTVPSNTLTSGTVKVFRPRYMLDSNIELYMKTNTLIYKRPFLIVGSGVNYIDIAALYTNTFINKNNIIAAKWQLLTTNTLIAKGMSPLTLTGATFSVSGNNLRINITGDYTAYNGKLGYIFGTQGYEQPYQIIYGSDPLSAGDNILYNSNTKTYRGRDGIGLKSLGGKFYSNVSIPTSLFGTTPSISTGITFSLISTNTVPTIPGGGFAVGNMLRLNGVLYVSTHASTPGTLTIAFVLGSTSLISLTIALPAGLTNRKLVLNDWRALCFTIGASGTFEVQGKATLNTGTGTYTDYNIESTSVVTVDTTANMIPNIKITLSGGNVEDSLTLRQFILES